MQHGQCTTVDAIASRDLAKAKRSSGEARHPQGLRIVRGAARRPRDRRHLQSASQPDARALDRQSRRGRQTRSLRKAHQHHRRRSQNTACRPRPHRRQDRRSLHDSQLHAMAARRRTAALRPHRPIALGCGFFSYFNNDPANIRNHVESGGGALLDIGCYCIQAARYGFGAGTTPRRRPHRTRPAR